MKTVHLGRYLYFMGTVHLAMENKEETLNCFKRSREILSRTPEYVDLVTELDYHISRIKKEIGESEDEDMPVFN